MQSLVQKIFFIFIIIILNLNIFSISNSFAENPLPLPVDKAFVLSVKKINSHTVQLHWQIAPGYHLYRDRFKFMLADKKAAEMGKITLPAGIPKQDNILGRYQVYINSLDLFLKFDQIKNNNINLLITYEGCSDHNFCYPPVTKRVAVDFESAKPLTIQDHHLSNSAGVSMQDKVTHLLEQKNYAWIFLAFIGFGILLAFTPCVLPMIPILSGIILGQNKKSLTTLQAFLLSLAYVLGMSVTYAIAGVLIALLGSHLSEAFQTPWVIMLFSGLFVLLALSLFGCYELRLPNFVHHRVVNLSNQQKSGSYIGAAVMGALSVLVVSPCVTAPLVGVLTFIAQTGDVILGSTALFALGLGMGIPLLIIGTTEGKFLPKAGCWMNGIKSFFGVLLIIVAIELLQRILPGEAGLILWSGLLIILSVYLGAGASGESGIFSGWSKFTRGLGLVFFCYGVILLVGAGLGNTDFLHPLKSAANNSDRNTRTGQLHQALDFQSVKSLSDVQHQIDIARKQGKSVMLDFYADWCVACHEMDRNVFSDEKVQTSLKNMVLLRANVTANDMTDQALEKYFGVIAPPTILFFDNKGREMQQFRIVGGLSAEDFLRHLKDLETRQRVQ